MFLHIIQENRRTEMTVHPSLLKKVASGRVKDGDGKRGDFTWGTSCSPWHSHRFLENTSLFCISCQTPPSSSFMKPMSTKNSVHFHFVMKHGDSWWQCHLFAYMESHCYVMYRTNWCSVGQILIWTGCAAMHFFWTSVLTKSVSSNFSLILVMYV